MLALPSSGETAPDVAQSVREPEQESASELVEVGPHVFVGEVIVAGHEAALAPGGEPFASRAAQVCEDRSVDQRVLGAEATAPLLAVGLPGDRLVEGDKRRALVELPEDRFQAPALFLRALGE